MELGGGVVVEVPLEPTDKRLKNFSGCRKEVSVLADPVERGRQCTSYRHGWNVLGVCDDKR